MSKNELRKRMTEIVNRLSDPEKQEQSRIIFNKLNRHPRYIGAKRLSIYLSTKNEIDTIPILRQALEVDGKQCFIPFVRKTRPPVPTSDGGDKFGTRMLMVQLNSMQDYEQLPVNNYGIKEPKDPMYGNPLRVAASPLADGYHNLDLVIVPGVAFAADGRRLGHGKGYYDEFLLHWASMARQQQQQPPYTLGLALKEQLVEEPMAVDGHDFKLDEVLHAN